MARKGLTTPVVAALVILLITPIGILGYSMHNPEIRDISFIGGDEAPKENISQNRSAPDEQKEVERVPDIDVGFTWTPSEPITGKEVQFWLLNSGREFSSVEWDFDDGNTATGERVTHRYENARIYEVNVSVETEEGYGAWETGEIEILEAHEPQAVIDYSANQLRAGEEIYFLAHNSEDEDGRIEDFYWDLDGTKKKGTEVRHVFESGGSKSIELTVVDDDGLEATSSAEISVEAANNPPIPSLDIRPEIPKAGENVTFDASDSRDIDGRIESYYWDLDDNFYQNGTAVEQKVFNAPGLYEISLRLEDDEGETTTITETVNVTDNFPPTAEIEYSPTSPIVDEKVVFEASATDEDGDVVDYEWDFNDDGTYEDSGKVTERYFISSGRRNVTLKVTDDKGGSSTVETQVNVRPADARYPDAEFNYNVFVPQESEHIVFSGSASNDPNNMVENYAWDFGNDGSYDEFGEVVGKTISRSGEYDVRLRIDGEEGKLDETTKTLNLVRSECQKLEINGKRENKIDILLVGRNYQSSGEMRDHFEYYLDLDQEHGGMFDIYPMNDNQDKFNIWTINAGVGTISDYGNGLTAESIDYFNLCGFADYNVLMSNDDFGHESFSMSNNIFISDVSTAVEEDRGAYGLMHHWGIAFGGLKPEYIDTEMEDNPGRPNCAPSREKAEEWWGDLAEDDPSVGYEQGCAYSNDNWEPHLGETIMSELGRTNYGPVNEQVLDEELERYG